MEEARSTRGPRDAFQRDRDRIIHSIPFRRLRHKTQVFVAPDGDHFRVRLTHSLEVAQIGRTIARALGLNEDLTEAPPNSPTWSGTIGYEHRFDLSRGMSLIARADMRWSASYDTSIDDSIYDHQGSFTRTDASLSWSSADDRLSVGAFIKNIENRTQKLFTLAPPVPFAALEISAPQTYGVSLSAKF